MTNYEFSPLLAELYDLVPRYIGRADIGFYLEYCRASKGRILELGCGTGRILIPAAEAGCHITGLDISPHMLRRCRDKLKIKSPELQERVKLVQGDLIDFNFDERFQLIILPFRVFQHLLDIESQMSALSCIYRHLDSGGSLIFDIFNVDYNRINNPRFMEETEDVSECRLPDGRSLRRAHRMASFHPAEQYNVVEMIYYTTDTEGQTERIVQAFPYRYFFRYEVEHLLARSGFELLNLYGDFDKSPLTGNSPEMIFVAKKHC